MNTTFSETPKTGFVAARPNYNGSSTQDTPSVQVPLNFGIIILTTCSILCNSVALYIIHGCRKLSYQMRFVTYNLLASYILFEFMIILHSVTMLFFGDLYHKQIYDSRTFFSCALVATLWSSLCAVTVERLVALTIPLHYNRYVTKTTLSISIACLWTVTVIPPSLTYTINGVQVCGQLHFISCDMHAHFQSTALVIIIIIFCLCMLLLYQYHTSKYYPLYFIIINLVGRSKTMLKEP